MENYEIYNDDCLLAMKNIPDNRIQLILTDPPYVSTECKWDKLPDLDLLFKEWKRVLTTNGTIVMTMAFPAAIDIINAGRDIFKYDAVWCKSKKTNFANAKNKLMRQHENILLFSKGTTANGSNNKMIYNPQGLIEVNKKKTCRIKDSVMGIRNNYIGHEYIQQYSNYPTTLININGSQTQTKHQTEKPVELFEYLIRTYSSEGDSVLDPFAGSGTTGVAAINSNRYPILIEKDPHWYEVSKERIDTIINKN
jgi:site-specific DNA-methyltransferase (adenine-specific)